MKTLMIDTVNVLFADPADRERFQALVLDGQLAISLADLQG